MKDDIRNAPSGKGAQQNKLQTNTNTPLILTPSQKEEVLNCFPSRKNQYFSVVDSLIKHDELLTGRLNFGGGVNISDVARKSINPKIKHLGIWLTHRPPKTKLKTVHGTHSKQVRWSFYPTVAIND